MRDQAILSITMQKLHLTNPPIVEAAIHIEVAALSQEVFETLKELEPSLSAFEYGFPTPVLTKQVQFSMESQDADLISKVTRQGTRFKSQDGMHFVQFNITGFVFSRVGKYHSWESFQAEAKRLWDLYAAKVGVMNFERVGLRYLNKIFVPADEPIEQFLSVYPHLPDTIPSTIDECFMRLGLPIAEPSGRLNHQHILLPTEKEGLATVLLDNDFRFEAKGLSTEDVWNLLERARHVKNEYFEKFLTAKMMERLDG